MLIIFRIEWRHQVPCLVGKQSEYCSQKGKTENHVFYKNGWKPRQNTRLDALIIFHIEWRDQVSSLVGKQSKYWSNQVIAMFIFCSIMVSLCTPCSCHDPTMFPPCRRHVPAMFPPCSRRVPWTPSLFWSNRLLKGNGAAPYVSFWVNFKMVTFLRVPARSRLVVPQRKKY